MMMEMLVDSLPNPNAKVSEFINQDASWDILKLMKTLNNVPIIKRYKVLLFWSTILAISFVGDSITQESLTLKLPHG